MDALINPIYSIDLNVGGVDVCETDVKKIWMNDEQIYPAIMPAEEAIKTIKEKTGRDTYWSGNVPIDQVNKALGQLRCPSPDSPDGGHHWRNTPVYSSPLEECSYCYEVREKRNTPGPNSVPAIW